MLWWLVFFKYYRALGHFQLSLYRSLHRSSLDPGSQIDVYVQNPLKIASVCIVNQVLTEKIGMPPYFLTGSQRKLRTSKIIGSKLDSYINHRLESYYWTNESCNNIPIWLFFHCLPIPFLDGLGHHLATTAVMVRSDSEIIFEIDARCMADLGGRLAGSVP
jgi:hypothetical protein